MRDQVPTTHSGLLKRISRTDLLAPEEARRIRRLLESASREAIAFAAHETVRQLVRGGRLTLRQGSLEHPGASIVAADERRGFIFALPALVTPAQPMLRPSLDPGIGPRPSFASHEIAHLIRHESGIAVSSVEQAADLKTVITRILDLTRSFLTVPAALFFSRSLPIPSSIARGPRRLILGGQPRSAGQDAPTPDSSIGLPKAWGPWVAEAEKNAEQALYLPDFRLLHKERRPLPEGSALLVPLGTDEPSWRGVLMAIAPQPFWFDQEKLARMRMLAPYLGSQLTYAVRLQSVVSFDFLTSVYNRASFGDHLSRTLDGTERKEENFALLIIDIDDFKSFNTRYGYDAGDQVLKSVARALARGLRSTDVLARYGGEEFAAILAPHLSATEAAQIAERLRAAIEHLRIEVPTLSGTSIRVQVTVSIGGALFPADGRVRDELWNQANRMLLEVKAEGKNGVRFPHADEDQGRIYAFRKPPPGS
jgi:diguanylate cyclase (GGDEF)-like protein